MDMGRLIVVAVFGMVGGILLSYFSLTTCNFVSIERSVGYYQEVLYVHAGMSSFTSMHSVFMGHSTCMSYEDEYYGSQPPTFAKAMGTSALICGIIPTLIVWTYVFSTRTTVRVWNVATVLAGAASLFQFGTFQFFFGAVCEGETCRIGAGAFMSIIAAATYAYMSYEMNRNCPVERIIHGMVDELICKKGKRAFVGKDSQGQYSAPDLV